MMKNLLCIIIEDYVHNGGIEIGSLKQTVLSFVNRKVVILLEDQVAKNHLTKIENGDYSTLFIQALSSGLAPLPVPPPPPPSSLAHPLSI